MFLILVIINNVRLNSNRRHYLKWLQKRRKLINPIQDGEGGGGGGVWVGQRASPTSLSPVTSINIGISHQNFLTFSLTHLPHWCKISSSYLMSVPNYWTWTKTTSQKNPYKLEVMITSLIEMLELPNFDQVTTSAI